jgi:hypothetical protein
LLDETIMQKISLAPVPMIASTQSSILSRLLSPAMLVNIIQDGQYDLFEYLDDLKRGIWAELYANQPVDQQRRNVQRAYVIYCARELSPATPPPASGGPVAITPVQGQTDAPGIFRAHLHELLSDVKYAIDKSTDKMTRNHLIDIQKRVERALEIDK